MLKLVNDIMVLVEILETKVECFSNYACPCFRMKQTTNRSFTIDSSHFRV